MFQADENLSNDADSKKACLSSNVEIIVSPSETSNDMLSDKDPLNEHQNSSINENSEPNDTAPDDTVPILQEINSTRYYFKIQNQFDYRNTIIYHLHIWISAL